MLALTLPLPRLYLSSFLLRSSFLTLMSFLLPFTMMVAFPSPSALSILLASSTCLSSGLVKEPVRKKSKLS